MCETPGEGFKIQPALTLAPPLEITPIHSHSHLFRPFLARHGIVLGGLARDRWFVGCSACYKTCSRQDLACSLVLSYSCRPC